MQVTVTKITDYDTLRRAAAATVRNGCAGIDPLTMYVAQHSPIRSQIFEVQMDDLPVAYSTHLLRHGVGFDFQGALTHRDDRGGDGDAVVTRLTPTKHMMILNAQAVINVARWRLCFKAHNITNEIIGLILEGVRACDPALARVMMPNCFWQGGICNEPRMCGRVKGVRHWKVVGLPVWDSDNPEYAPKRGEQ
jgi:hypothetical protein